MEMQPPRGTRDFLPEEMIRRNYIFDTVKSMFERFGFVPMQTPAFEYWELLNRKKVSDTDIKDEIYYFKDKGGRELGLRFDLTVPMARVVATNPSLLKPFKRYQVGRVWRYDRPQTGRFREFWQADIDIVGSPSMECELECLMVAANCLLSLGFDKYRIKLNSRKILNAIVQSAEIKDKKVEAVYRALDKLNKVGEKEVLKEIEKSGISRKKAKHLLKSVKTSGNPATIFQKGRKLLRGFTEGDEGIKELEELYSKAKSYGIQDRIDVDFSLVRGLGYYTGPIFEIVIESKKNVGSVAGGGRYDNLIELYGGKWTPAVGVSLGVERLYEIMVQENMFKTPKTMTKVFVVSVGENLREHALLTAQGLRNANINTQVDLMGRSMKSQLEYADNAGIPWVVFIGEKEFKDKTFTLKNMKTHEQKSLALEDVIKVVKAEPEMK